MGMQQIMAKILLRPLSEMSADDRTGLLRIRNERPVRQNMYTDHLIGKGEHQSWLGTVLASDTIAFFGVYYEGLLCGGLSFSSISRTHRRADWAFYLSEATQGKGIGSALEFLALEHAFGELGLEKLNCEVIATNQPVVKLHHRFGFVEEGRRRCHVRRNDDKVDACLLGITRQEWADQRTKLVQGAFR
jgi:UDP-4-amino-4,6-dideoxy-N-acetyl-beta-L-altrosamine N-acetyltransferase